MTLISIITPCFNEEQNIDSCVKTVREIMENELPNVDYEHIFSDNSSQDRTVDKILEHAELDTRIKLLVNSRNIGPFNNMWSALKHSSGTVVIPLLPADLQDPPEIIPRFYAEWQKGNLIVFGVREEREESLFLRVSRKIYYKVIAKLASSDMPLNAGEFMLVDRRVLDSILAVDDAYPYIRGLVAKTGVKSTKVKYRWKSRKHGKSKNSYFDLIDQGINGLVSTSRKPARIVSLFGLGTSFVGIVYAITTLIRVIISRGDVPIGIPSLLIGVFLIGGIQLLAIGILGEYLLSIHSQVRRDPQHFIVKKVNLKEGI